jgi:hypothetical protein
MLGFFFSSNNAKLRLGFELQFLKMSFNVGRVGGKERVPPVPPQTRISGIIYRTLVM